MNEKIPYRFSRRLFNRQATLIGTALARFPELVAYTPSTCTPAVFAQYVRDAIQGKQRYHWVHPEVDETSFGSHSSDLIVSVKGQTVYVGGRHASGQNGVSLPVVSEVTPPSAKPLRTIVRLNEANRETVLHNICQLVNAGCIETEFELHGMNPELIPVFEMNYAVSFVKDGEAYVIELQ